mmetsp:Transcript_9756/g.59271  ORF Transcript_9756/g.59271 Transcript_9756/m.59271 type:complete len:113 (-) Transcript_9756:282-620(-)
MSSEQCLWTPSTCLEVEAFIEVRMPFMSDVGLPQDCLYATENGQAHVSINSCKHLLKCSYQCTLCFILHVCLFLSLPTAKASEPIRANTRARGLDLATLGLTTISKVNLKFC